MRALRFVALFSMSGCSMLVDFDEPKSAASPHDGYYVTEGELVSDSCPGVSEKRTSLRLSVRGQVVGIPFQCVGSSAVTGDTFERAWSCPSYAGTLSGQFRGELIEATFTLAYPSCTKVYMLRGARERADEAAGDAATPDRAAADAAAPGAPTPAAAALTATTQR